MATKGNYVFLASVILSSNASTVSFSGLSSYEQFKIIGSVKTSSASKERIHYRFNSSTGNYSTYTFNLFASTYTEYGSTVSTVYTNFGEFVEVIPSSRPSQEFTAFSLYCANASDTTAFPLVEGTSSLGIDGDNSLQHSFGQNISITSAVSSFQLFLSAGDFVTGSSFYVYGIK